MFVEVFFLSDDFIHVCTNVEFLATFEKDKVVHVKKGQPSSKGTSC